VKTIYGRGPPKEIWEKKKNLLWKGYALKSSERFKNRFKKRTAEENRKSMRTIAENAWIRQKHLRIQGSCGL